jgi:hypothetical protein
VRFRLCGYSFVTISVSVTFPVVCHLVNEKEGGVGCTHTYGGGGGGGGGGAPPKTPPPPPPPPRCCSRASPPRGASRGTTPSRASACAARRSARSRPSRASRQRRRRPRRARCERGRVLSGASWRRPPLLRAACCTELWHAVKVPRGKGGGVRGGRGLSAVLSAVWAQLGGHCCTTFGHARVREGASSSGSGLVGMPQTAINRR